MLYKLLSCLNETTFHTEVVSLVAVGAVGEKIRALRVPVRALGMRRGVPNPLGLWRLARWLRRDPPDMVQTWLYHADLIGGLAAKLAGGIPVAWNIRHSTLDPEGYRRSSFWTVSACAQLSRWLPTRIICCSEASQHTHAALGYAVERMVVIPNGFDLTVFRPASEADLSVRQELGISGETPLIGLVGRFHPQKDHQTFVRAAALLHARFPETHFLLCGDGITWGNIELASWIETAGLSNCCHLLGHREDIPRLTAALDIASSSSAYGEGFPNVLGEAMASGVPCVATDVGDAALIMGDTGKVVPAREPQALAEAWRVFLEISPETRRQIGWAARRRIEQHFSLPAIATRYAQLYEEIAMQAGS